MGRLRKVRWPLLAAAIAALAVTGIAGATHFGPFDLEHTNGPTDVASGVTGSLNGPVLFGTNSNSGTTAYGVQGGRTATTGTGAGVRGFTHSASTAARGVLGQVFPTSAGALSAGVRGINGGTGANGIGVWGSQNGSGWGVYGSTPRGVGVRGDSTSGGLGGTGVHGTGDFAGVSGIGTNRGVSGVSSGGSGIVGESTTGYAGSFGGGKGVAVDRNLRVGGNILALEGGNVCPRGAVNGIVAVDASGTFSSSYTSVGVTGFNCNGGSVLAKRNSTGNYTVLLGGNASALWAVGNSTEITQDGFVIIKLVGTTTAGREFQVIVLDKDGGNEDNDFVVVAF